MPQAMTLKNFEAGRLAGTRRWAPSSSFSAYAHEFFDPSLTWDMIAWLKSITRLPVLLKGILTPEDAPLARHAGIAGIVVSNHGGRQLDGAEPAVRALPRVVDEVDGKPDVLMDGGVRRSTDVLQALVLGARAVLVRRPYLWGLAVPGEEARLRVRRIAAHLLGLLAIQVRNGARGGCNTMRIGT